MGRLREEIVSEIFEIEIGDGGKVARREREIFDFLLGCHELCIELGNGRGEGGGTARRRGGATVGVVIGRRGA